MNSQSDVKAAEVIEMFQGDLERAMQMSGTSAVHGVVGWLPPDNPHTDVVVVQAFTFGTAANQQTVDAANTLLNEASRSVQHMLQVNTTTLVLNDDQHFGFAVEDDIVVVCISDSPMFTDDFCARLAENIVSISS